MGYNLGIDLGTTYVAAAVGRAERVEPLGLGQESPLMPSAVYQPPTGEPLVGDPAMRRLVAEPGRVSREFKRGLGDRAPIVLGQRSYRVAQLLTTVVGAVVAAARDREDGEPDLVVLTRPANWGPLRRSLFDEISAAVDGPEVLTVTEPQAVAAHLAATERLRPGEIVAVYDLGGGSFDATVLARRGERVELLGRTEGVERLGGADVDDAVFRFVDETCGGLLAELDLDDPEVRAALARLRLDCGIAKETLSRQDRTTVPVRLPDRHLEIPLTRARLETMVTPFVEATIAALERSLRSAGVTPEQLSSVHLLGGMARMPLVATTIAEELGCPTEPESEPKRTVALGAVILGERLTRAGRPRLPGRPRRTPPRNIWSPGAFGAAIPTGAEATTDSRTAEDAAKAAVRHEEPVAAGPSSPRSAAQESRMAVDAVAPETEASGAPAAESELAPEADSRPVVAAGSSPGARNPGRPNDPTDVAGPHSGAEATTAGTARPPAGPDFPRSDRTRQGAPPALCEPADRARSEPRPSPTPPAPAPATPAPPAGSECSGLRASREVLLGALAVLVLAVGLAVAIGSAMTGSAAVPQPSRPPRPPVAPGPGALPSVAPPAAGLAPVAPGPGALPPAGPPAAGPAPTGPPATALPRTASPAAGPVPANPVPDLRPATSTPTVLTQLPVGPTPEFVAVNPDGRSAYVTNPSVGTITVVDVPGNHVRNTIAVPAGPPRFIVFNADGSRAYVSVFDDGNTRSALVVIDTSTNAVLASVPMRAEPFVGAVTRDGRQLWVPNHDAGQISIVDTATATVVREVRVAPDPRWIVFTPDGRNAVVTNDKSSVISVMDTATAAVRATVRVGRSPHSVAVHPTLPLIADSDYDAGTVTLIDEARARVIGTVPVGKNPRHVVWSPDARFLYVVNGGEDTISVLDARTHRVSATVPTQGGPTSMAVTPDGRRAYVSNSDSGTLTVLTTAP